MIRNLRHLPMAAFVVSLLAFDAAAIHFAVPRLRDAFETTRAADTARRARRIAAATVRAALARATDVANDAVIGAIKNTTVAYRWMLAVTPVDASLAGVETPAGGEGGRGQGPGQACTRRRRSVCRPCGARRACL
jgi:hypothetical protein